MGAGAGERREPLSPGVGLRHSEMIGTWRVEDATPPPQLDELDYAGLDPRVHDELRARFGSEAEAERGGSAPDEDPADRLDRP